MAASLRRLILPLAIISVLAGALAIAAYATHVSAQLDTSIEYAEYRNDRWHYSLAVPTDMSVSEYDREGGGHTVQFMDATGDKELIISAWPYTQLDLTLGREGAPSQTSDQPGHLEIVNVLRDDVFKILFTKDGTLYVVPDTARMRSLAHRHPHHLAIHRRCERPSPTSSAQSAAFGHINTDELRVDVCVTRNQFAEVFGNHPSAAGASKSGEVPRPLAGHRHGR